MLGRIQVNPQGHIIGLIQPAQRGTSRMLRTEQKITPLLWFGVEAEEASSSSRAKSSWH